MKAKFLIIHETLQKHVIITHMKFWRKTLFFYLPFSSLVSWLKLRVPCLAEVIRNKMTFIILSKIDDGANPLVKHLKRVKDKFLLKITYIKSQTDKSRYSTTKSWSWHSTSTKALMLLQMRVNVSNRQPKMTAMRAKRANTEGLRKCQQLWLSC